MLCKVRLEDHNHIRPIPRLAHTSKWRVRLKNSVVLASGLCMSHTRSFVPSCASVIICEVAEVRFIGTYQVRGAGR